MSDCGTTCSRCSYGEEGQVGGSRGNSAPCGSEERQEREAHVTGGCELGGEECSGAIAENRV